ncbi:hypothetical protein [Tomitella cavernea]|uniref:Uncharacterized protein n=1 Tax=Tomitella cavernea TaxID=1387982 RepID=A0ABP9D6W6_9ACTN
MGRHHKTAALAEALDRLIAHEVELHRELLAVLQGDEYPDMDGEITDTLSDAQLALTAAANGSATPSRWPPRPTRNSARAQCCAADPR